MPQMTNSWVRSIAWLRWVISLRSKGRTPSPRKAIVGIVSGKVRNGDTSPRRGIPPRISGHYFLNLEVKMKHLRGLIFLMSLRNI